MADKGDTNWFSNPDPEDLRSKRPERQGPPEIVVGGRTYDLLPHSGHEVEILPGMAIEKANSLYAVEPPYYKTIKELAKKFKDADNPNSPFNLENDLSSKSYPLVRTSIAPRSGDDPYVFLVICLRDTTGKQDRFVQALEDREGVVYTSIKAFVNETIPPLISSIEDVRNSKKINLSMPHKLDFATPYLSTQKDVSIKLIQDLLSPGWRTRTIYQDRGEGSPMTVVLG